MTTLGVIGLGRMGYRTVLAGRQVGLQPVALLDSLKTPWAITQEEGLSDLLRPTLDAFLSCSPEVVAISTTADSHAALFEALAEAGVRRILVEKPIACSVAAAEQMTALAERRDIRALVNHNSRNWCGFQRIRALRGSAEFGDLRAIVITQGAGGFGNLGTHYVDLANWMFDEVPEAVASFPTAPEAGNPRGEMFHDPGGVIVVRYPSNRRLILEMGDDVGVIGGFEFRFNFGRITIDAPAYNIRGFHRRLEDREKPKYLYGLPLNPWANEDLPSPDVVRQTGDALSDLAAGRQNAGATLAEGRIALETIVAARIAAQEGLLQRLPLPLEDRGCYLRLA